MPASYPTSVYSPASKNTGDIIQAAHVNDLQAEVTAIEGGLLNGTAPLNSSGSTMVTLNVTGLVAGIFPCCRVINSATQAVASGAYTGLNWDGESYDSQGMHSTSVNSSRITFTASTGLYLVGAQVEWSAGSTGGQRIVKIMQNDTLNIAAQRIPIQDADAGGGGAQNVVAHVVAASTTDYVTVRVLQDSGSTQSIAVGANFGCNFWAQYVSSK
jgi:hypothetical protein